MNDDNPSKKPVPRANPIQPDKPWGAIESHEHQKHAGESADRARRQSQNAMENNREFDSGSESIRSDDPAMAPNRPASDAQ